MFGKGVRARERLVTLCKSKSVINLGQCARWNRMHTRKLAGERFLARVGSEVRDKCETRSLRETTTSARGPFTGVVGFVHANVICGGHKISVSLRALRRNEEAKGWRKGYRKSAAPSWRWRMNVLKSSKASPQSSH